MRARPEHNLNPVFSLPARPPQPPAAPGGEPRLCAGWVVLVSALVALGPVYADAIYKSVDAQGKVTYSSAPPAQDSAQRVEELRIQTGLEAPASREADAPATPTPNFGQQRASAIRTAQQALIRAKAELEQTKIQGEGDWRSEANGGKVLTAEYTSRVAAAQAKVEAAEQDLKRAHQP